MCLLTEPQGSGSGDVTQRNHMRGSRALGLLVLASWLSVALAIKTTVAPGKTECFTETVGAEHFQVCACSMHLAACMGRAVSNCSLCRSLAVPVSTAGSWCLATASTMYRL